MPITQLLEPVISSASLFGVRLFGRRKGHAKFHEFEFITGLMTPVRATIRHLMRLSVRGALEVAPYHMPGAANEEDTSATAVASRNYMALARAAKVRPRLQKQ